MKKIVRCEVSGAEWEENVPIIDAMAEEIMALKTKLSELGNEYAIVCHFKQQFEESRRECERLLDENKSLKFNLEQKAGEIGPAEHRGNTVDYIYDKVANYGRQINELRSSLQSSEAQAAGYREVLEKIKSRSCDPQWKEGNECSPCLAAEALSQSNAGDKMLEAVKAAQQACRLVVIDDSIQNSILKDIHKDVLALLDAALGGDHG